MNPLSDLIKGGLSGIADSAEKIIARFKADPTKALEIEADLQKLKLQAETEAFKIEAQLAETYAKELESVNATMRAESQSEHWMQWAWRPTVGFTFAAILVNNYILLPYFVKRGMEVIVIPGEVWGAIMVILGVASAGRSFKGVKIGKRK